MTIGVFCLAVASTVPAVQAGERDSLPRVVITATRVDTPTGHGIAAATVIDRASIERSGVRDLAEVLRLVPGVSIARSGGPGAQSSLFLRGGENDYVRVLVDGVQVNDPGGAVDLAWLSVDEVDRVEVVRGPASVLYGTDAVSGVIQVFTRQPSASRVEAELATGRYGSTRARAGVSGGPGRFRVSAGAAREESDGILAFNSDYARATLTGTVQALPGSATRLTFTVRGVDDEYHFPTDGAGTVTDRNAYRVNRRLVVATSVDHAFSRRVRGALSLSALDTKGRDDDRPDSPADTIGFSSYDAQTSVRRRVADARLNLLLSPASVLTIGGELSREGQRGHDSSNYSVERSRFSADRHNGAVYGQWLAGHGPLSVTAGARYDENSTFGAFRTARLGVSVSAWRGATLRATAGTAFKGPTFFESFNTAFSTGNASLVPERSRGWEAGVRQVVAGGRLTMSATWFDQRFRDMIQYAFVSPDQPNYFNVAAASARGLEVEAGATMGRTRPSLSATFLRSRVDDAGLQSGASDTFVHGNRLLRRPGIMAAGTVAFDLGRTTLDVSVLHTGRRDDRDFTTFPATPVELPSWTRLDLGATRAIPAGWSAVGIELFARLENALGASYQEIVNYPAPGRSLTIGVRAASLRR